MEVARMNRIRAHSGPQFVRNLLSRREIDNMYKMLLPEKRRGGLGNVFEGTQTVMRSLQIERYSQTL